MRRLLPSMLALTMVMGMSGAAAAAPGPGPGRLDAGLVPSTLDHRCGRDPSACPVDGDLEGGRSIIGRALEAPWAGHRNFTMAFTGDLILHAPVNGAAARYGRSSDSRFDFEPMFGPVAGILSEADLAICHLEVPLSPTSTGLSGYPTFLGPGELAAALVAAGYDGCSVASN
ncbi:MAG: CapA family protein, partial [Acidimicrobiia bacterium]|nr:CapA family protein [Acidimicrobiia bacterium]